MGSNVSRKRIYYIFDEADLVILRVLWYYTQSDRVVPGLVWTIGICETEPGFVIW